MTPKPPTDDLGWYRGLVGAVADLVLATDADGVIEWSTPATSPLLGYAPGDLVGRRCFDLIHPDERDLAWVEWQRVLARTNRQVPTAYRVQHADGGWVPMNVFANNRLDHPEVGRVVLSLDDVSRWVELDVRARQTEAFAHSLLRGSADLVLVASTEGVLRYASPAISEILGYQPAEVVGRDNLELIHPDDLVRAPEMLVPRIDVLDEPFELRVRHADGSYRVLAFVATDLRDDPTVQGLVFNVRDVTQRHQAEQLVNEQAELLEAVARGAPLEITLQRVALMIEHTLDGHAAALVTFEHDGAMRVRAPGSLPAAAVRHLEDLAETTALRRALDADGDRWREVGVEALEEVGLAAAGRARCRVGVATAPGDGARLGAVVVFDDPDLGPPAPAAEVHSLLDRAVTLSSIALERRRFESALEYQALYDPLTGLPNRELLRTRVHDALVRATRLDTGVAVLFIDLDRFRVINDSVGHAEGDDLLRQVTERFRRVLRAGDTLGRFGGDSFVVVCARVAGEQAAVAAAERFSEVLAEPFAVNGGEVFVSASIGIALADDASVPAETLVRNADVAMYRAKDQGRKQWVVFQPDVDSRAVEQLALEQALRAGIDNGEFELYFQPAVRLSDGAMTKVEALVRWMRPGHGLVSPGTFIPLAEETGLVVPLGTWILRDACRRAATWPRLPSGELVEIAVNLSARQLADAHVIEVVEDALASSGVDPGRICFEVTESALVGDVENAVQRLRRLKDLGVKLAIDDFGTGYATLDYVRHFSMADYLKIDRSFVDGVEREGSQEQAIVRAAIALAKSLGLTVVAEGVETLWQMEALRALDCDLAQGFLFSRPLPADLAVGLLAAPQPL